MKILYLGASANLEQTACKVPGAEERARVLREAMSKIVAEARRVEEEQLRKVAQITDEAMRRSVKAWRSTLVG